MGWKIRINDPDSEIWDHEIELIVRDLPTSYRKFIPVGETMKQVYGYPAYGTISIPDKDGTVVSGSYITTRPAEAASFLIYIIDELKRNGHKHIIIETEDTIDMFQLEERLKEYLEKDKDTNRNEVKASDE